MSRDDFKIVVNSTTATGVTTNNASLTYNFVFQNAQIKPGFYELRFVYNGANNDLDPAVFGEILINFNLFNTFATSSTSQFAVSSTHIGWLRANMLTTTAGYLYASLQDNAPTIIERPVTNNFTVTVLSASGALFTDNASGGLAPYGLELYFHKIHD